MSQNVLRVALVTFSVVLLSFSAMFVFANEEDKHDYRFFSGNVNVYALYQNLIQSGPLQGDVYGLGAVLKITDSLEGDVSFIGTQITVDGTIDGDLRLITDKLDVNDSVTGDLLVVGGSVSLSENAIIGGTVGLLSMENININGTVLGDVSMLSPIVDIRGTVVGSVYVTRGVEKMTIHPSAVIMGDVYYESSHEEALSLSPDADVRGEVIFEPWKTNLLQDLAQRFALLILFALVAWWLLRFAGGWFKEMTKYREVRHILVGFFVCFALVLITVFSLMLALLIKPLVFFSIFAPFLLAVFICVGFLLAPMATGILVYRCVQKEVSLGWEVPMVGALVLTVCSLVPVLYPMVLILTGLLALGSLFVLLYHNIK